MTREWPLIRMKTQTVLSTNPLHAEAHVDVDRLGAVAVCRDDIHCKRRSLQYLKEKTSLFKLGEVQFRGYRKRRPYSLWARFGSEAIEK
jgi:hypothetical protein